MKQDRHLEPACWIPILRSERVIFAGDHLQLPPTIKSNEAARSGLAETLFEKRNPETSTTHGYALASVPDA